jgi:RNA polymerase sigma-70 factor, ECF subfamily
LILSKRFRAIGAVLAGDREAYRQIITACEAKVRIVLAAILPVQDMVDDIAQEVFVTAYGKLRDYEPGSDFVAWLKAIARNLALNERRR